MPDQSADSLLIFTADKAEDCLDANNSAAWRLNINRARNAKFVILARNAPDKGEGHRAAFLIAKIKDIVPRVDEESGDDGRFAIVFDQAAEIDVPGVWERSQMPLRYVIAEEVLGQPPESFAFRPVPKKRLAWSYSRRVQSEPRHGVKKLTLAEAREGLAAQFGCSPSAVNITITA